MRGRTWNRRHSSRRFAPSANASLHSSSRTSCFSRNGIENLMVPLLKSVHHVPEHLFTMSPVRTLRRGGRVCTKRNARRLSGVLQRAKDAASAAATGSRHVLRHLGLFVRRRVIVARVGAAILQESDAAKTG